MLGFILAKDIISHAKLAILTVGAYRECGIMDCAPDEAALASTLMQRTNEILVLTDSSKLNRIAPLVVADWHSVGSIDFAAASQDALRHS